jgi:hypothetical protein
MPMAQHPQQHSQLTEAVHKALAATVVGELWHGTPPEQLTWRQMAEGCMWGMFLSLPMHVRVVGAWVAHASAACQRALRSQQASGIYTMGLVSAWWNGQTAASQQEYANSRAAATALFSVDWALPGPGSSCSRHPTPPPDSTTHQLSIELFRSGFGHELVMVQLVGVRPRCTGTWRVGFPPVSNPLTFSSDLGFAWLKGAGWGILTCWFDWQGRISRTLTVTLTFWGGAASCWV